MGSSHSLLAGMNQLIDGLVHPALRHEPDVLYRTRVLITLLLTINLLMVIACAVIFASDMSSRAMFDGSSICLGLLAGNVVLLYVVRSRGSLVLCSLLATLLATVVIISGIILAGGIRQSPATQILVVPPLMAYFFAGMRWGTFSVLLVIAVTMLFFFLESMGVTFPRATGATDIDTPHMLATFICVAAVSAMALMFEHHAAKLKQERDIEHDKALVLAETDILTGLANRRSFDICLSQRMASQQAQSGSFTLCYVDLDGFKPVNDNYGHAVGDEVLRAIAIRLRHVVRDRDVIGRHGGDEFTLLLDAMSDQQDMQWMMQRMLVAITQPVDTSVGPVTVGASVGLARYPLHGRTVDELKRAADQAMYAAKRGKTGWQMYTESSDSRAADGAT